MSRKGVKATSQSDLRWQFLAALIAVWWWAHSALTVPVTLDELGSWGLSSGTFQDTWKSSALHQGQAPLYFMSLWIWRLVAGDSVLAMRLLSLPLGVLTIFLIHRAYRLICGENLAPYATLIYACSPLFATYFPLARPYALANCLLAGLFVSVSRYATRPSYRTLLWSMFLAGALATTHYLYLLSVPILVGVVVLMNRENPVRKAALWFAGVMAGVGVSLTPIIAGVWGHTKSLGQIRYHAPPTWSELLGAICALEIVPGVLSVILVRYCLRRERADPVERGNLAIILLGICGALTPTIALFCLSRLSGGTLFIYRYRSGAIPFTSLAVVPLMARVLSPRLWRTSLFAMIAISSLCAWQAIGILPRAEGKTVAERVSMIRDVKDAHCSFYISTGFIELQYPDKIHDPLLISFLKAPISYFLPNAFTLLPLTVGTRDAMAYWRDEIMPELSQHECVYLIPAHYRYRAGSNPPLSEYLERELPTMGFDKIEITRQPDFYFIHARRNKK